MDWWQNWKCYWITGATWGTFALRERWDKVSYHSEGFPIIHKWFLEKHKSDFYSYYLHVDLDTKHSCIYPRDVSLTLKAMHSVNGHLWTWQAEDTTHVQKYRFSMIPIPKEPLRDKHVIPTKKAVIYCYLHSRYCIGVLYII